MTRVRSMTPDQYINKKIIKIAQVGSDKDIWQKLQRLKTETEGVYHVITHHIGGMSPFRLRKMVECFFHNTGTKVTICTTEQAMAARRTKYVSQEKKQRDTHDLIVEQKGKDYKSLLGIIKTHINNIPVSKAIKNIRSTKEGKLLIILEKNENAIQELEETINNISKEIKTRRPGQNTMMDTLHIRGMYAVTQAKDVVEAIENKIGPNGGKIKTISEIRPNANNTQAITISSSKEDADKLALEGQLRIGVVNCTVEKRINLQRCFRCWCYDHIAEGCKGPDRLQM